MVTTTVSPKEIERVALALWRRVWRNAPHGWTGVHPDVRDHYREMARVAIRALLADD